MATGFGIVGCGMISYFHARAINDIRGAKLVGGFDTFEKSAKKFGKEFGCEGYTDLAAMLDNDDIDVITIATPSGAHLDPAVQAARAGKHVIVEKPLEITLKRCDKIINECEKAGVTLSTIFPSRFHGPAAAMKKAIDQGRFGTLAFADSIVKWFRTQEYYDSGQWRGTWALDGGGALMNQAIHSIDLLTWLMGPVEEISANIAMLAHKRIEVEDVASASLKFANGALGSIVATTAAYPGYLKRVGIHGSEGSAELEEEDIVKWDFHKSRAADKKILEAMANQKSGGGGAADPSAIGHHGHRKQFEDVLKAIKKGVAPSIDGYEGRRSVEIILAIYKAAQTGKNVKLPLTSDPVLKARKEGV